jgi:Protein of unknown function (DUF1214)
MLGMLWPLGVEKGKEFKPSDKAQAAIAMAIPDVLAVLKNTLLNVGIRWWSDRRWRNPAADIGPRTGFNFETPEGLAVDDRAVNLFFAFGAPEELALKVGYDQTGQLLRGENSYRLHVPANIPASQFWSVTPMISRLPALSASRRESAFHPSSSHRQMPMVQWTSISALGHQQAKNPTGFPPRKARATWYYSVSTVRRSR